MKFNTTHIGWAIAGVALIWFLWQNFQNAKNRIPLADAKAKIAAGAVLLDVRSPGEYGGHHIDGAKNIPLGELSGRLGELPKDKEFVLYCRSGNRSGTATRLLKSKGYSAFNLGGIGNWQQ